MGAYVNSPHDSKEEWLRKNWRSRAGSEPSFEHRPSGTLPVCVVDNGLFTAAAICFSETEFKAFMDPDDPRPKSWCYVDVELLKTVSPELEICLESAVSS